AVRLLFEWSDPHRQGVSRPKSEGDGRRNQAGTWRRALSLLRSRAYVQSHSTVCENEAHMTTGLSRRDFLARSGALVVSFSMAPMLEPLASGQGPFDTHLSHIDPSRLDSWIALGADGIVTAYTGKCDFGQGMYTAQAQLVAEELSVPIERVRLIQCDTSLTPDQGTTSGSQSTPTNFNTSGLAQAAATAREALIKMAAQSLGVPASQLAAANGFISAKGGRRVSCRDLVAAKKFNLTVDPTAKRRTPREWTV